MLNLNVSLNKISPRFQFYWISLAFVKAYHVNKLREFEFELHCDGIGDVDDGSDQLVVAGEEVIEQPLGVGVTLGQSCNKKVLASLK